MKISSAIGYAYNLSYKYAGNSNYGAISGSVNLKVKKGTSLAGSSSTTIIKGNKYSVTLKDSSGNVLSSKKSLSLSMVKIILRLPIQKV